MTLRRHIVTIAATVSLLSAACGGSTQDTGTPTVAPSPTEASSPSPETQPGLWREGIVAREDLGSGIVEAATAAADGSPVILVSAPTDDGQLGCEGMPLFALHAVLADGTRTAVLDEDGVNVSGSAVVPAAPLGPGSPIAFVDGCEGFTSRVWTGVIGDDGIPTGLRVVAGYSEVLDGGVPGAPPFTSVPDGTWSWDGSTFTIITSDQPSYDAGSDAALAVWSLDVASGIWSEVEGLPSGATQIEALADGQFVTLVDGDFRLAGETFPGEGAERMVVSPDGQLITASGPGGIVMLDTTGFVRFATSVSVSIYGFFPDGSGIAFARLTDRTPAVTLYAVDLETFEVTEYGDTDWAWFAILPDTSGLAVTISPVEAGAYGDPALQRWTFPAA